MLVVEGFDCWVEYMIFIFMLYPIIYMCMCVFLTKRIRDRSVREVVSELKRNVRQCGK